MTRAEELAGELQSAIDRIHQELDAIPDERWTTAMTPSEGWRVGHAAHHIGEGYLQSLSWIQQAVATGKPVLLDPAVGIPRVNAANAHCLEEHGGWSRAETMAFMKDNAGRLVAQVRTLSDDALDNPMMMIVDQVRLGREVAVPMSLRHVTGHMESIRGAS